MVVVDVRVRQQITPQRESYHAEKGKPDEISDQGVASECCSVVCCQHAWRRASSGVHAGRPDNTASDRSEFRAGYRCDAAGSQARGLAVVSRELSGLGLQSARADQQDQCEESAIGMVTHNGARSE